MKISLKWLNQFVDVQDFFSNPDPLAQALTRAGLEVEDVQNLSIPYQKVKVGLVLEKQQHPNADKLTLCRVSTGDEVHQIVCGAKNHKAGDKVVVALPGAILPGNFAIKKSLIRQIESAGMMCSLKELALATESEGIYILPAEAPVGLDFASYADLDDIIFELKVTPNRSDCLSHYGLAREVACVLQRPLKPLTTALEKQISKPSALLQIHIKDTENCGRYCGQVIRGVRVAESPAWLKSALNKVGMSSINNIVDITNYIMLELGQPLHAFDMQKIQGGAIVVDKVAAQEKFIKLDGKEVLLTGQELGIRDSEKTLCLAGVIGGQNSGVNIDTKDIFLESAYFAAQSVRKTSRSLGIETDSAYRFSRGIDASSTLLALQRAVDLILQAAGGSLDGGFYDIQTKSVERPAIKLRLSFCVQKLGYLIDPSVFVKWMKALGCQVSELPLQEYEIYPPTYRADLQTEVDLIEEYARLYGYEHIPEALPAFSQAPSSHDPKYLFQNKLQGLCQQMGFFQSINLSFYSEAEQKKWLGPAESLQKSGLVTSAEPVCLLNPLSEDLKTLRQSLSLGLWKNTVDNIHRDNAQGRLFEIGSVFLNNYQESLRLGFAIWGQGVDYWSRQEPPLFYQLKAAVENILKSIQIFAFKWEPLQDLTFLHPGKTAVVIVEGQKVGFVGHVHPAFLESNKVRQEVVLAELSIDILLKGQPRGIKAKTISKLPIVDRDLSFLIAETAPVGDILADIKKSAGALVKEVILFDHYTGDKVDAGYKSVSVRLRLQGIEDTLQDAQIQQVQQKVIAVLQKNFHATVR